MLATNHFGLVFVTLVLGICIGCEPPKFYDCEGVVTRDGKPIPRLQITFAPDIIDSVRMPLGLSDEQGRFEMFSGRNMGVPPGAYRVYVEDPGAADGRQTSDDPDYLYVINRYSAEKSDYKYVADRDQLDFELKLDTKEYVPPAADTAETTASLDVSPGEDEKAPEAAAEKSAEITPSAESGN